ncbi:MAG: hypothetical protein QXD19_05985 [Candidatus Bathyarchaeia archaeon]
MPSALTVDAPKTSVKYENSIVISGTVTDISPGTKQAGVVERFPNGLPVVSDANMDQWMEYVYLQQPCPTNDTGVPVTISVLDSNNNYGKIGAVTSDADGFFSFVWKPEIPGKFTVYASFDGSKSYWPSHAVTAFNVDPAPEATPSPTPISMAEQYFMPLSVGMIIAIVVVIALLALMMLRKRP